ncbi:pyridoxal phosphate-dependent aminotransferase [Dyadobacter fermentans]|uniref:Aminotransferase class I and II n=1 Tax=Dyadobacter fermentans (strain ATCC 700827 / DSM 18053 / CIP 107007 / KCTC 52180 / NS114) TaxID=471854 RepID=C6W2J0_DYAFD|nr:histidinol-phosphate transaminase [Dyadobacter fermentans]ACT93844.1 aminotransferase class I and II [Dyadobacter fermentans DSM 18053]
MNHNIDRRNLLKSGLMALGGMAIAPHLTAGAFENTPLSLDPENRIYRSPMVREHFLPSDFKAPKIVAKLSSNENPYGPPMTAQKAVAESVKNGNRYAWKEMYDLIDKIAKKEGVTPDHIMMGPGSSDLLEKVALVTFMKGGNIVSADPCYMSLVSVAKSVGATWKPVPCTADWSHDLKAMEAAIDKDTKLVYVCNPNNPTGAITKGQDLLDFCSRVSEKVPVFVDEAYIELAVGADTQSMVSLLTQKKNVIIARTFSKIMGMAGIRVGYIAAQPEFLAGINKITRGGMGISYTSIFAASASLDDKDFQGNTRKLNHEAKTYLYENLDKMGYKYIPSYTNFVLFPISIPGKELLSKMTAKGIAVRSFDVQNKPWCRVSIGTMDEMKAFVGALGALS